VLLGPASLAGKLLTLDNQGPTPEGNSALPGNVTAILAAGDYERAGRRRMLNGPAYAVEVYRDGRKPTRCDGVVYLMPMTTNAEASTLLAHPGTLPVVDAFFVFQGRIVEAFPSYSHWLARFTGRIICSIDPLRLPDRHPLQRLNTAQAGEAGPCVAQLGLHSSTLLMVSRC
jgi:hypothetical protein